MRRAMVRAAHFSDGMNAPPSGSMKKQLRKKNRKTAASPALAFPAFCDFSCPHADFAPTQSVGACRREQAIYCTYYRKLNNKHSLCLARKQGG
jgi:hypothetical protein